MGPICTQEYPRGRNGKYLLSLDDLMFIDVCAHADVFSCYVIHVFNFPVCGPTFILLFYLNPCEK